MDGVVHSAHTFRATNRNGLRFFHPNIFCPSSYIYIYIYIYTTFTDHNTVILEGFSKWFCILCYHHVRKFFISFSTVVGSYFPIHRIQHPKSKQVLHSLVSVILTVGRKQSPCLYCYFPSFCQRRRWFAVCFLPVKKWCIVELKTMFTSTGVIKSYLWMGWNICLF